MPIKCPQEVLGAFNLLPHIFSLPFLLIYIASSNPKSICIVLNLGQMAKIKEKNSHETQFYNLLLDDSLTKRLVIIRHKFSSFPSLPQFSTKSFRGSPTGKTIYIWHSEPLDPNFVPLWCCWHCFLDLDYNYSFSPGWFEVIFISVKYLTLIIHLFLWEVFLDCLRKGKVSFSWYSSLHILEHFAILCGNYLH